MAADGPQLVVRLNRIPELGSRFHAAVQAVLGKGAFDCEASIIGMIQAKGIIDTGRYMNSWRTEQTGDLEFRNSSDVEYGPYQEFGTSKMAARPHVFPSFERIAPQVVAAMKLVGSKL